ncbi:RES family NAD+ phosphorylase [Candidatus Kaistella beijingensis]|uniref:RES family NAD+ phosphorylase n=1 Tax=Candidatus Kaistella beijingensis TaxID=2820270 RepID=UPI001CC69F33|nr:RES family NAD+ phosphorylase [Candidatus Kaistella beijingensis]UBB89852.1 RES family NAD+ phosphorylase [Candidatus Kaistella beijingensis]HOB24036.1 RES family NAD+ phosphorylase [Kaistella sp.]HQD44687.1 RES family NAD+ phosphorylase [Kaistella sp.]
MLAFRIAHYKYAHSLSVSGFEGRWNSKGKLVLYASENIATSLLENIIYRTGTGFNNDYKIMVIYHPEEHIEQIITSNLPKDWRSMESYDQLQKIGDSWYDEQRSLCLKVPSSILPDNYNVIFNTTHPEFKNVKLIDVLDYEPDERLEKLLKKYKK